MGFFRVRLDYFDKFFFVMAFYHKTARWVTLDHLHRLGHSLSPPYRLLNTDSYHAIAELKPAQFPGRGNASAALLSLPFDFISEFPQAFD
jgi:hypothetical protein